MDFAPPAPQPTKHRDKIPFWLPLLLGFLQAVGPISIDMYLPAFPAIEAEFHTSTGSAQITLATWVLGLSVGQMLQGALSDRFGRRRPLIVGTALYTLGAIGCALSGGIPQMAFWRFIAALGGSASMIAPRAVVRDIADGTDATRLMSRLILILGAAPILAPSLGGLVLQWATWRDIFWITAGYGALGTILAAAFLPDTLPYARRVALHPVSLLRRWRAILTERGFLTHALMLAFSAFSLFAYLGGSPVVFIQHYHMTPGHFAILFGGVAASYVLCAQINVFLIRRLGLGGVLRVTSNLYLLFTAATVVLALTNWGGAIALGVSLALAQGMIGFLSPSATVGSLTRHAAHAGSASALLGTLQFLIGCSSGFMIGPLMAWMGGSALPMAVLMALGAVAVKLADRARPAD